MSCVLSIMGANFDVDDFVLKTGITNFEKQYKGDPLGFSKHRKIDHSRAFMEISSADFDNFSEQIEDATRFLKVHKQQLALISSTPGIEEAYIDFGINSALSEHKLIQSFYFTKNLISVCAELGIEILLSTYKEDIEVILEKNVRRNNRNKVRRSLKA